MCFVRKRVEWCCMVRLSLIVLCVVAVSCVCFVCGVVCDVVGVCCCAVVLCLFVCMFLVCFRVVCA